MPLNKNAAIPCKKLIITFRLSLNYPNNDTTKRQGRLEQMVTKKIEEGPTAIKKAPINNSKPIPKN